MYMRKENGKRESPYKGILKFADEKKPQLSFAVVLSVLSSASGIARANGMTVNRILWKKVFRNALPPVITLFCQYVSYLIAGSAVVEKVFSIKGVGNYLMRRL